MNFIVIVVALLLDQVLRPFEHLRAHRWYERPLAGWARQATAVGGAPAVLAALAPSFALAFAVGAVGWGLARANVVIGFVYAVVVLVASLGPRDLTTQVSAYLKARGGGDAEGARVAAHLILESEPPADPEVCSRAVVDAVLVRAGDRLFCVVFWFAVLGPLGAVLYRSADVLSVCGAADSPGSLYARATLRLKVVMAWIPLHLLAFTYAVAGSFDEAMSQIKRAYAETAQHFLERGSLAVAYAGHAAIRGIAGEDADEIAAMHSAVDLIWRGVVIWLTVIGVITLLGWIF